MANDLHAQLVVLGSGPAGYTAAFRAADLGLNVVLIERYSTLGGVCLNVGCIPSKALLHVAQVINQAKEVSAHGVTFGEPQIDIQKILHWKDDVIGKLTQGLAGMAKARKVQVVEGYGRFTGPNSIAVEGSEGTKNLGFDHCIIAAGSSVIDLPFLPKDPRVIDSTGALKLEDVPGRMLVIGGGIIGLEMSTVYAALGSKITVVELADQLIPVADKDLVKVLEKDLRSKCEAILLETKVVAVDAKDDGLWVTFEGKNAPAEPQRFDKILSAVGRKPNGKLLDAEKAGVAVDERGFINVDKQLRTNVAHIHAIGDIVGQPMLAHKGTNEGRVAAEVIAGKKHFFEPACIPSVAYTDPEIAWVGLTEKEAKAQGLDFGKGVFPWAASGRALGAARSEGMTKVIYDNKTHRLLGCGIVGINAGELISEAALAIEMGCDAEDIALTIHPHPTLSESICFATEVYEGTCTDLPPQRKK